MWSIILLLIGSIALIVYAGLSGKFLFFIIAIICALAALIISQAFTLEESGIVKNSSGDSGKEKFKKGLSHKDTAHIDSSNDNSLEDDDTLKNDSTEEDSITKNGKATDKKPESDYSQYDEKSLKKIMHEYKVKKDHRTVLIDGSNTFVINQCPAYIWVAHNAFHILLIEKEPRHITIPEFKITSVEYLSGRMSEYQKEYIAFNKPSIITNVFSEYLPDYISIKGARDNIKAKNLYMIYPDICFTNNSASQLFDLLYLDFKVSDNITLSSNYNDYFKNAYKNGILLRDKVMSIESYKNHIKSILEDLSLSSISQDEYDTTIEHLLKHHLITKEYADFYSEYRRKHL